ncbi:uncharacterized protein FFC1_12042 [Fusarium fujikuroi]|nr:uncharacterized protein FFC1_12042 [Fusarium fujikuroi]
MVVMIDNCHQPP